MKTKNVKNQILRSTNEYFLFDLGHAKNMELDNSRNSLVGCCALGTGHFELFILSKGNLNFLHYSKMPLNHKIFYIQVEKY